MPEKDQIFKFKEFSIRNSQSAMRVNTDGVLVGAWAYIPENVSIVWDVGGGTGLIAMMIAQRCSAEIFSIEIDSIAHNEMTENFIHSNWSKRLHPVLGDFSNVWDTLPKPQLIISNPPYFDNCRTGLKSSDNRRATARHEASLTYESLIKISSNILSVDGLLCMISPVERSEDIEYHAINNRMYVHSKTLVKTTPPKPPKRILWEIGKEKKTTANKSLTIYSHSNLYSDDFKQLVKAFYLYIDD